MLTGSPALGALVIVGDGPGHCGHNDTAGPRLMLDGFPMNELFASLPLFFAQDGNGGSIWSTVVMLAADPVLVYFLLIRPQQQTEQKRRAMMEALKKNDKVVTTGGIYGTVISVDGARTGSSSGRRRAGGQAPFTRASMGRVLEASAEKPADKSPETS